MCFCLVGAVCGGSEGVLVPQPASIAVLEWGGGISRGVGMRVCVSAAAGACVGGLFTRTESRGSCRGVWLWVFGTSMPRFQASTCVEQHLCTVCEHEAHSFVCCAVHVEHCQCSQSTLRGIIAAVCIQEGMRVVLGRGEHALVTGWGACVHCNWATAVLAGHCSSGADCPLLNDTRRSWRVAAHHKLPVLACHLGPVGMIMSWPCFTIGSVHTCRCVCVSAQCLVAGLHEHCTGRSPAWLVG